MKILLVYPQLNNIISIGFLEPLVLEIFSAIAKQEKCETEILDLRIEKNGLKTLYKKKYIPDLVALSTHGYAEIKNINKIAKQCKSYWKNAKVIVGGGQCALSPWFFDKNNIDHLVQGPGENIWRNICKNGLNSKEYLLKDDNLPKEYSYPLPDREITLKYKKYYKEMSGLPATMMPMTQGCPFKCSFCAVWKASLGLYRKRPIKEIIAELKTIKDPVVYISDDNTLADSEFSKKIIEEIKLAGIKKMYVAYGRADHICKHPENIKLWSEIGLKSIIVGVEAVVDSNLEKFNKKTSVDENSRALNILRDNNITPIAHFILTPEMKREDYDKIYDFICEHKLFFPIIVPLTPLPGTTDYDYYHEKGLILTDQLDYYTFNYNVIQPKYMTIKESVKEYERLWKKIWSFERWLNNRQCSFYVFLKSFIQIRLYLWRIGLKRKKMIINLPNSVVEARLPLKESVPGQNQVWQLNIDEVKYVTKTKNERNEKTL